MLTRVYCKIEFCGKITVVLIEIRQSRLLVNLYIIIKLVVRRLNAYVGKERIHCFSVVRPVAMTQMQLSWLSGATEIQNNSSLLVIRCTRRVILDFRGCLINIYLIFICRNKSLTLLLFIS